MLVDVTEVRALDGHRLFLRFDDGTAGEADLDLFVCWEGIFAPLREDGAFRQVRVNPELRCVEWPNGADLDSEVLYAVVTGNRKLVDSCAPLTSPSQQG